VDQYEDDPYSPRAARSPRDVPRVPYFYPGTNVLENKLDIRNDKDLLEAEGLFAGARERELRDDPSLLKDKHGYQRLQGIHGHLFQDLYEWAGKPRTVNIGKDQSRFEDFRTIDLGAAGIFKRLDRENNLKGLDHQQFSERAAHYYNELNKLHPFREGNGRALRLYFSELARDAGHKLEWSRISPELQRQAAKEAFFGDRRNMVDMFKQASAPTPQKQATPAASKEQPASKPASYLETMRNRRDIERSDEHER